MIRVGRLSAGRSGLLNIQWRQVLPRSWRCLVDEAVGTPSGTTGSAGQCPSNPVAVVVPRGCHRPAPRHRPGRGVDGVPRAAQLGDRSETDRPYLPTCRVTHHPARSISAWRGAPMRGSSELQLNLSQPLGTLEPNLVPAQPSKAAGVGQLDQARPPAGP